MDKPNVFIHTKDCYSIVKNEVPPNRITENWVNWKLVLNVKQTNKKSHEYGIANIFTLKYVCMWQKSTHTLINIFCGGIKNKNKKNPNGVLVQVILWMNLKNMIGDRNQ